MPERSTERRVFHDLFEVAVVLKAFHGLAEIVASVTILFFNRDLVQDILGNFTGGTHGFHGWVSHQATTLSHQVTPSAEAFIGIYLLAAGVANLFLAVNLLRNRLWAYPATIAFLVAFIGYEIYRYGHTHSPFLAALMAFDVVVIWLIWNEYRHRRAPEGR